LACCGIAPFPFETSTSLLGCLITVLQRKRRFSSHRLLLTRQPGSSPTRSNLFTATCTQATRGCPPQTLSRWPISKVQAVRAGCWEPMTPLCRCVFHTPMAHVRRQSWKHLSCGNCRRRGPQASCSHRPAQPRMWTRMPILPTPSTGPMAPSRAKACSWRVMPRLSV